MRPIIDIDPILIDAAMQVAQGHRPPVETLQEAIDVARKRIPKACTEVVAMVSAFMFCKSQNMMHLPNFVSAIYKNAYTLITQQATATTGA